MLIWRDWQQSWLNIGLFFAFLAVVIIDGTFKAQLITVTFWGLLVSLFAIFSLRILFAFNMASLLVLSLWLASEIKYSYLGVRLFWQDFSLAKTRNFFIRCCHFAVFFLTVFGQSEVFWVFISQTS